jgi:molybdate transport system permease protein
MEAADLQAILLTLKLAFTVTLLLLIIGIPSAWWLARSRSKISVIVSVIVAMPLILPPTVMGFYMLIAMGPDGFIGELTQTLGMGLLPFTFTGLVIASIIYSLPFMIQPLQTVFESVPDKTLDIAATLRASPLDTFFTIVLPMSKNGILTAVVLTFAHTVGEFGVILMIGGNIPGVTQVVSVQIYDHVESMQYHSAHQLSAIMLVFSFFILLLLQVWKRTRFFAGSTIRS